VLPCCTVAQYRHLIAPLCWRSYAKWCGVLRFTEPYPHISNDARHQVSVTGGCWLCENGAVVSSRSAPILSWSPFHPDPRLPSQPQPSPAPKPAAVAPWAKMLQAKHGAIRGTITPDYHFVCRMDCPCSVVGDGCCLSVPLRRSPTVTQSTRHADHTAQEMNFQFGGQVWAGGFELNGKKQSCAHYIKTIFKSI